MGANYGIITSMGVSIALVIRVELLPKTFEMDLRRWREEINDEAAGE